MPLPPRAGGKMMSKQVKTSTPNGFIICRCFLELLLNRHYIAKARVQFYFSATMMSYSFKGERGIVLSSSMQLYISRGNNAAVDTLSDNLHA